MNTKSKLMHRPTLSSDAVFELVDILESIKRTNGLSNDLTQYLNKLDTLAYEIGKGTVKPAYEISGVKEKSKLTLESLDQIDINNPINQYSQAQIDNANMEAANHYVMTGEKKDWKEFIIPIDEDIFKLL